MKKTSRMISALVVTAGLLAVTATAARADDWHDHEVHAQDWHRKHMHHHRHPVIVQEPNVVYAPPLVVEPPPPPDDSSGLNVIIPIHIH